MSGMDPLAAIALRAVANAQAAIEEATLNLGAVVSDVQSQLSVGDLLSATVLSPQDGSDRISLLGHTLPAQLPSGIDPGETIALQVTGFTNTAIIVRNLGTVDSQQAPPEAAAPSPQQPPRVPVAPPRELFVAASVKTERAPGAAAPATPRTFPQPPAAHAPAEIEARLIATRASTTIGAPSLKREPQTPAPQRAVPSGMPSQTAPARAPLERAQQTPLPTTPQSALLTRLRVPVTPTTLAAAKLVEAATKNATAAYEKLDAVLAKLPPDPRAASLRSTLSFVARFDLRNTRALPEQIASYVSNVVTSAESKTAQIVRAWTQAEPLGFAQVADRAQPLPGATVRVPEAPVVSQSIDPSLVNVAARAAERAVALDHDVKTALLQLVADPPPGSSTQVIAALRDALTATTAAQLNALAPENNTANTIAIPLPAYFYDGGQPAQVRISRDARNGKNPMDADNFHIAFVLDTKSLGTVAIDVQTAGRSVRLDVKTETARSADRFRTSLGDLRGRLQALHYRVATMAAGIAPRVKRDGPAPPSRTSNVDTQA